MAEKITRESVDYIVNDIIEICTEQWLDKKDMAKRIEEYLVAEGIIDVIEEYIWLLKFHADGYSGSFQYLIKASSLPQARKVWRIFLQNDASNSVKYAYEKAEAAVKRHYGGFITWEMSTNTKWDNANDIGDYYKGIIKEMKFDNWNSGSDHLND